MAGYAVAVTVSGLHWWQLSLVAAAAGFLYAVPDPPGDRRGDHRGGP